MVRVNESPGSIVVLDAVEWELSKNGVLVGASYRSSGCRLSCCGGSGCAVLMNVAFDERRSRISPDSHGFKSSRIVGHKPKKNDVFPDSEAPGADGIAMATDKGRETRVKWNLISGQKDERGV